jgi:hypothetical protein
MTNALAWPSLGGFGARDCPKHATEIIVQKAYVQISSNPAWLSHIVQEVRAEVMVELTDGDWKQLARLFLVLTVSF